MSVELTERGNIQTDPRFKYSPNTTTQAGGYVNHKIPVDERFRSNYQEVNTHRKSSYCAYIQSAGNSLFASIDLQVTIHPDLVFMLDSFVNKAHWIELIGILAPNLLDPTKCTISEEFKSSCVSYRLYAQIETKMV